MRWLIVILCLSTAMHAQQDLSSSLFHYNRSAYNPAVAGTSEYLSFTALVRDQWSGLDGSPKAQNLTIDIPMLKQNIGLGFNLINEEVGIQKRVSLISNYAYRLVLDQGFINIGINMSFRNLINDFSDDRLLPIDGFDLDPAIDRTKTSFNIFNFGAGAYYQLEDFYFGIAVPRIRNTNISAIENMPAGFASKEIRHYYALLGKAFQIHPDWNLSTDLLVRHVPNAPFVADIHLQGNYREFFVLGTNYRTGGGNNVFGESIAAHIGFQVSSTLLFGLAYDFSVAEFNQVQTGSVEFLLRYTVGGAKTIQEIINPRYQ